MPTSPSTPNPAIAPRRPLLAGALAAAALLTGLALPAGRAEAVNTEAMTGLVSNGIDHAPTDGVTGKTLIAGQGRFVAFTEDGSNTVPGLGFGNQLVYVRDLLTDDLEVVSVDNSGTSSYAWLGAISTTGRFVAFVTADQLVPADTNGVTDVYVRDRTLATTTLVSVSNTEQTGDAASGGPQSGTIVDISDDGRYVAFESDATNLITGDTNGNTDVFWRDTVGGTTSRVSANGSTQGDEDSRAPSMSSDGMWVAFSTMASNLVPNDTNGLSDVLMRHMDGTQTPERISKGVAVNPNGVSDYPSVSGNGKVIAFLSRASNLVAGDTNGATDVFVRNLVTGTTTRASVSSTGAQLTADSWGPRLSPNGTRLVFETKAKADPTDEDDDLDIYLRSNGVTTSRQSIAPGAADDDLDAVGADVSEEAVVWGSTAKMTSTDSDSAADVFIRRTPYLGPHATAEAFATSTRQRILGSVTPAQTTAGAAAIRAGTSPEHQVVALLDQPAFRAKRAPVVRLYWAYFTRRPDLGGLTYWVKKYESGMSLQRISLSFAKSSEFATKYGNTTPTQFVTLVYQNVLERLPEAGGLAYWAKKIDGGTSRGQVMTSFSESSEGVRTMAPYVESVLTGVGLIGKMPS
ncbi:MAG: DUF4214 domain-containing protein, partial [Aquihabitans sp.]